MEGTESVAPETGAGQAQGTEPKQAQGGFKFKNEYAIYAVAVVLLVVGAWWFLAGPGSQPPIIPGNQTNGTVGLNSTEARILFASLDRITNLSAYSMSFSETEGKVYSNTTLIDDGSIRWTHIVTPIGERDTYYNGTNYTFCEKIYDGKSGCAPLINSSYLLGYSSQLNSEFLDAKSARDNKKLDTILINGGAMKFVGGVGEMTISGKRCWDIAYTIDYGKLNINDLREIGLSPDDPTVTRFRNYTVRQCIDDDTGVPLEIELFYYYEDTPRYMKRTLSSISTSGIAPVAVPETNMNETQVELVFADAFDLYSNLLSCDRQNTTAQKDTCFTSFASDLGDSSFCSYVTDSLQRDRCGLKLAAKTGNWSICNGLSLIADDCYIEAAGSTRDAAWCNHVQNASAKVNCAAAANGTLQQGTGSAGACSADTECKVGGCSNQLCIGLNDTGISTCEFRPEYACYTKSFAKCGCVSGSCRWKDDPLLAQCIVNATASANSDLNVTGNRTNSTNGTG